MRVLSRIGLLWFGLLAACAASSPIVHESNETPEVPEVVASWEEGCEDERTLLPLCDENGEECGLYRCKEVVPRETLLAFRGGGIPPIYTPGSPASPRRWWRRPLWLSRDTQPVLTFRFNRHFDPKPSPPLLPAGRWVRHHILPQARELRDWFHGQGVPDIHQFTLLIPEHVHLRIHSGGPRGGEWNRAWHQFKDSNLAASPAEIYRHAGELIFRFQLTGPVVPYVRGGR